MFILLTLHQGKNYAVLDFDFRFCVSYKILATRIYKNLADYSNNQPKFKIGLNFLLVFKMPK